MNSNNTSKRNKNRSSTSNISMSSNIHNKPLNRMPNRNSNGQTSLNPYHSHPQKNVNNNNNNINKQNSISNSNCSIAEFYGAYKNRRLVHSITSLIGCLVEVQLADGKRYEGILKTFSPEFELVISSAAPVIEDGLKTNSSIFGNLLACLEKNEEVSEMVVIDPKKMVKFKALNVDLEYATKNVMLTDGEIAKTDPKKMKNRDLVPWNDDEGIGSCIESLDGSTSNGWQTEDMFKFNESTYNIVTSYRDDMSDYTIPLEHRNDDEYRQREAQAEKIAREIEQDTYRIQRYAKEDDADEETRFSAVVRDVDETSNTLPNSNYTLTSKNEGNHAREERRESMRNNSDNAGFRNQNSRQNRNRISSGRNINSGVNEPNWREVTSNSRMNSNRYHQSSNPSMSYSGSNSKSGNNTGNYANSKYSGNNSNHYNNNNSASPKSSYSAVSARNLPNDSVNNEIESKTYSSRNHGNKDHYTNEDNYNRKSSSGLAQRENFKQRNAIKNNEQEPPKSNVLPSKESDNPKVSPSVGNRNAASPVSTNVTPTSESTPVKVSSQSKPEISNSQQSIPQEKTPEVTSSNAASSSSETKSKSEPIPQSPRPSSDQSSATNSTLTSPPVEVPKEDDTKKTTESSSAVTSVSTSSTSSVTSSTANTTTSSAPTVTTSSADEIVKSSNLNPNAKSFTPRGVPTYAAPAAQVVLNYPQYQTQHISTTPPSIPSTPSMGPQPNQYIQINHPGASHLPPQHPSHHHPQQSHVARYNTMQFQHYNMIPQMVSAGPHQPTAQYITVPTMMANTIPHSVFATPIQASVPGPATSQSAVPPNASVPGAQMPSHHMIQNSGPSQGAPQTQQVQSQQRGQYRTGNKGASNHGSQNSNQHSQQYIRQQQHHVDYNQQAQVANATGQPILTANVPPSAHQIQAAYSTAANVHHHNQGQQHGQQPQNISAAQLAPQPVPNQPMPYMAYPGFHSRPINLIHQGHPQALNLATAPLQPGIHYDPHQVQAIYCEVPPTMVPAQALQAQIPQGNPAIQSSSSNAGQISGGNPGQPSNNPSANQVAQAAPPQQAY